jgi:hypothetical protein
MSLTDKQINKQHKYIRYTLAVCTIAFKSIVTGAVVRANSVCTIGIVMTIIFTITLVNLCGRKYFKNWKQKLLDVPNYY